MPQEFERQQMMIMDGVIELKAQGKALPRKTRLNLSVVYELDLDPRLSPSYVSGIEAALMPEPEDPKGGHDNRPKKKTEAPDIAHLYEDTSETIGKRNQDG